MAKQLYDLDVGDVMWEYDCSSQRINCTKIIQKTYYPKGNGFKWTFGEGFFWKSWDVDDSFGKKIRNETYKCFDDIVASSIESLILSLIMTKQPIKKIINIPFTPENKNKIITQIYSIITAK